MIKKRFIIIFSLIILVFSIVPIPNFENLEIEKVYAVEFPDPTPFTISNSMVRINSKGVSLNVTERTRASNADYFIELSNDNMGLYDSMNFLFVYSNDEGRPTGAFLYDPHEVNETKSYTCDYEFNYTQNPNYFWCYQEISEPIIDNQTNTTIGYNNFTIIVKEHSFETGNLGQKIAYWNESHIENERVIGGYTQGSKWGYNYYRLDDVPFDIGANYQVRIPMNFNLNTSGKIDIFIWPSELTIDEAITLGHYIYVDPWWDVSKEFRRLVINSSKINLGIPYSVNDTFGIKGYFYWTQCGANGEPCYVYYNGDFLDLAFANETTEYFWENATDNTTGNNYQAVWEPHNLALHMESNNDNALLDSTTNSRHGAITGSVTKVTGKIGSGMDFATGYVNFGNNADFNEWGCLNVWVNPDQVNTAVNAIAGVWSDANNRWGITIDTAEAGDVQFYVTGSGWKDFGTLTVGQWSMLTVSNTSGSFKLYNNAGLITTFTDDFGSGSVKELWIGGLTDAGGTYNGQMDEFTISPDSCDLPEIQQMYWGDNNLTYLGDESYVPHNVTITSPSDGVASSNTTWIFDVEINNSDTTVMQGLNISIYNVSGLVFNASNTTEVINGSITTIEVDILFDNIYDVFAQLLDGNDAVSTSANITITRDTVPPENITIQSPSVNNIFNLSTLIDFNISSVIDAVSSVDSCWRSIDGGENITLQNTTGNWNNQTLFTSGKDMNVKFYCNDTVGNINTTIPSVSFAVIAIDQQSPTNDVILYGLLVDHIINISCDPCVNVTLFINDLKNVNFNTSSLTSDADNTISYSHTSTGVYNWSVELCSGLGCVNSTQRNYTVTFANFTIIVMDEVNETNILESIEVRILDPSTYNILFRGNTSNTTGAVSFNLTLRQYVITASTLSSNYPYSRFIFKTLVNGTAANDNEASINATGFGSFKIWLISIDDEVVFPSFIMNDLTNTFPCNETIFRVIKYINATRTIINQQVFDVQCKVPVYLLVGHRYILTVDNGDVERINGEFFPISSVDVSLVIRIIDFPVGTSRYDTLNWNLSQGSSVFAWLDTLISIDSITVTWFNASNPSQIYNTVSSTSSQGVISFVPSFNGTIGFNVFIQSSVYGTINETTYFDYFSSTRPRIDLGGNVSQWMRSGFSMVFVIIEVLTIGPMSGGFGYIAVAATIGFFSYIGWLPLSPFTMGVILIVTTLSLISARKRGEEGYT